MREGKGVDFISGIYNKFIARVAIILFWTNPRVAKIILPNSYLIFWEVVGLERGPLSLVRIIKKLLERKVVALV
jgi:hypothetical protein